MIFKFGRKKFSDVVKVVDFLDKENIDYEVMTDIEVGIGEEEQKTVLAVDFSGLPPQGPVIDSDPDWVPANHDDKFCTDKEGCKDIIHYGGELL